MPDKKGFVTKEDVLRYRLKKAKEHYKKAEVRLTRNRLKTGN